MELFDEDEGSALRAYINVVFNLPLQNSFTYIAPKDAPAKLGYRVEAPFGGRKLIGVVIGTTTEAPSGDYTILPINKILDEKPLFDETQIRLARWISQTSFCSLGEAIATILPSAKSESKRELFELQETATYMAHELSLEQQDALSQIVAGDGDYFYLYGITGSGKSEVFLQAAKAVIAKGKSVIYLVPEIALTHQLINDVFTRFEGKVALLHSSLTPSQRLKEWHRIRSGEASLVIGARSAIFAPAKNIGLIIIDEEHESSYKSDKTPRYHARQVAMHIVSASSGINLIMGSATPSLEAYYMMKSGRFKTLRLTKRLSGGALPKISIIDMAKENSTISSQLKEKIIEVHQQGKQSILFLNRRGFNHFFHCKSCGYQMRCKNCSVALTYYKKENVMKCHYCGYVRKPILECPECGSLDVGYSGFGTEMVEQEVAKLFPHMRVARIDSDSVSKKGELGKILSDFKTGKIDLLLGTQMVAKGLNFPKVALVGIVLADTTLYLPDFRATERCFSLITQVAGRAGRYALDGQVYIQTYSPKASAVLLAANGRSEDFYKEELATRELLGFPPFCRLGKLLFRGKDKEKVVALAQEVFSKLHLFCKTHDIEILGPAQSPIAIINKNYRYHILLRSQKASLIQVAIREVLALFRKDINVYVEIDIDPVSLL